MLSRIRTLAHRLMALARAWIRGSGSLPDAPPVAALPVYRVHAEPGGLVRLSGRGDHPRVTQLLLDVVRSLAGRPGVVLVEYGERPTEWVATEVSPAALLAALVSIRDQLGRGPVDLAIHSRNEGVEVFLDHLGELEVRAGAWNEHRFRDAFARRGFVPATGELRRATAGAAGAAGAAGPPADPEARARLAAARDSLGLAPVPRRASFSG